MKKFHLISVPVFILGLTIFASPVQAATVAVQGSAELYNSNGQLHFSGFNSNVTVDSVTGLFSGYAWSDDFGWVAFGAQDNEQGPVLVDLDNGQVRGVAKILSSGEFIDFTANNSNVTLNLAGVAFAGYLFDETVGWIHFASPGVHLDSVLPANTPEPTPTPSSTPLPSPTPTPTSGGGLPTTGSSLGDLAVLGGGLVAVGGGLRVYRKRRVRA